MDEIISDSDSSRPSSTHKMKTRFPLLDEVMISESDQSTSSALSKEIEMISNITINKSDLNKVSQSTDSTLDDHFEHSISENIVATERCAKEKVCKAKDVKKSDLITAQTSIKVSYENNNKKKLSKTDDSMEDESVNLDFSFEEPFEDSGSEYVPDSEGLDDEEIKKGERRKTKKYNVIAANACSKQLNKADKYMINGIFCHSERSYSENELEDLKKQEKETDFFIKRTSEEIGKENLLNNEEEKNITVAHKVPGKRTHDKKHACLYCKQLISKLPRHLEAKHAMEIEVAEFMAKPLNSKERKQMIENIRQTGNYLHNSEAIISGKGLVIPKRRPNNNKEIKDFTPCGYCHGLFAKKYIYAHKKQCALKHNIKTGSKNSGKMTLPVGEDDACKGLQEDVLSKMRSDELYHIVRTDSLILRFGSELYKRLGNLPHLHVYLSQRMRQLARYLKEIKNKKKEIANLSDSLQPKYYNDFVEAVKSLGKYDEKTGSYGIPTLPLRIRTSIQQCASIYKSDLIIKGQTSKRAQLDDFVTLIEMNYRNQVSSQALNSAYKTKWNKNDVIPLASDINVLTTYLKEKAIAYVSQLKQEIDAITWVKLCEITLVQTLLFNRRSSGEVERMYLETYKNRDDSSMNKELENTLTDLEKQIAKNLTRIEVRGKRGRKVPILLPSDLKMQIDLLINTRETVGVPEENPYLFASINSVNHMRSSDKLREMAGKSGVKDPQSITSTKLRKHVATAAQLLNLKDNEMDSLATYMGHDIRVHRQYYRLPDGVTQLTKVSKLLLSMDSGNLSKNKNKNFDNMSIDENNEPLGLEEPQETERPEELDYQDEIQNDTATKNKKYTKKKRHTLKSFTTQINRFKDENTEDETEIESNESEEEPIKKQCKVVKQEGKKVQKKRRECRRRAWTPQEKDAMNRSMAIFWLRKKVPNKKECEECLIREKDLERRSWTDIKNYVYNVIKKNNK